MRGRRALIVGAGTMGRVWGQSLRDCPDVVVAGWVDLRPDAAAQAADALGLADVIIADDLDRALATVRPDFVVDVTVPEAHFDVTMRCLAAGVPVLGEKPMAHTLEHAHQLVAAARSHGQLFMVSQNRRYDGHLQSLRRLIVEDIGPLGILNSDFYLGAHFGGFRDEMPHVLLLDMAIHTFDAARFLSGADPVSVYCEEFNPPWSWYQRDASATALFEMTGGLRYSYRGSWCSEGRHTAWEADWRAVGPHGTVIWDGHSEPIAEVVLERGGFLSRLEERTAPHLPSTPRGIAGALNDFIHALETGATPMGECQDNIKSLAMVFAAIESAEIGQRVKINV